MTPPIEQNLAFTALGQEIMNNLGRKINHSSQVDKTVTRHLWD